ncbi:MAG TPA: glutaredoxin domain-containing protein [Polyangia bacterium]
MSASWCQPCQQLKARLKAAQLPFKVVDVDSSAGGRLADELGVATVPAVFVKTDDRYVRVQNPSLATIRAALQRHEERECSALS